MLSGPGQFAENETNEVNFREIPSHVLQKVCMYFTYKVRYTNSSTEIPEFPIQPEIALELLMAANFLDCKKKKRTKPRKQKFSKKKTQNNLPLNTTTLY